MKVLLCFHCVTLCLGTFLWSMLPDGTCCHLTGQSWHLFVFGKNYAYIQCSASLLPVCIIFMTSILPL